MTIPPPYDWILALSLILFPLALLAGLLLRHQILLRHQKRIRETPKD